jgi:hypothetical protein
MIVTMQPSTSSFVVARTFHDLFSHLVPHVYSEWQVSNFLVPASVYASTARPAVASTEGFELQHFEFERSISEMALAPECGEIELSLILLAILKIQFVLTFCLEVRSGLLLLLLFSSSLQHCQSLLGSLFHSKDKVGL